MPRFFRIMSLLCVAVIITTVYYGFVDNKVYATKTLEPYIENPNYTSSNGIIDPSRNLETVIDNDQTEDIIDEINSDTDLDELGKKYPDVRTGGWYIPPNGSARQRVAIIVPYRDRQQNLAIFLKYMYPFLMKQQIEYRVIVVEQEGKIHPFNRGKLLNVGFVESQKLGSWQCFIFHDVDLLPLDPQIQYQCSTSPRHLCSAVKMYNITLPLDGVGGVAAITKEQLMKANGYPNRYWLWGGEDNDLCARLEIYYTVTECYVSVGRCRYIMLNHSLSTRYPESVRNVMDRPNHSVKFDKPQILVKEKQYIPRMLREAIEIKKYPNFNREDGFSVPPAWDPVIHLVKEQARHRTVRP